MSNCYGHSSVVVCVPFYSVVLIGESWSWTQLLMSIFFHYFLLFHKLSLCIYDICFRVMGIGLTLLHWALNMFFALGLLIIQASNIHLQKKRRRWLFIVCLIVVLAHAFPNSQVLRRGEFSICCIIIWIITISLVPATGHLPCL